MAPTREKSGASTCAQILSLDGFAKAGMHEVMNVYTEDKIKKNGGESSLNSKVTKVSRRQKGNYKIMSEVGFEPTPS